MNLWCLHGAVGLAADWDVFKRRIEQEGHRVHASIYGVTFRMENVVLRISQESFAGKRGMHRHLQC